jgi:hypothetical protein
MMQRVFGVTGAVGRMPPNAMPFVLPQAADRPARRRRVSAWFRHGRVKTPGE